MIRRFGDISIRRKLVLLILVVSGFGLFLACAAFVGHEVLTFRKELLKQTTTLADIVGYHSSAALTFQNSDEAQRTLQSLALEPNVKMAAIYTRNGDVIASYSRPDAGNEAVPAMRDNSFSFSRSCLHVFRPIVFQGEAIGTAYLRSSLEPLWARVRLYLLVSLILLLAILLVTWWLANRFQKLISEPVISLVSTAKRIAEGKDYSLRARKYGADELGSLVDEFNTMLSEIQARDRELEDARAVLEKRVSERTADLSEQVAKVEAAQVELRKQEEFVRNVLDLVPSAIAVKRKSGHLVLINRTAAELHGRPASEMIGKTDREFNDPEEELTAFATSDHEIFENGTDKIIPEFQLSDFTGKTRWMQMIKRPFKTASGESQVLIVATDISARREAALEMLRAKEAAEAANRAKTEFLANMSHEIRTPMNGIIGMANLLLDTKLDPEQRELAETVATSSEALLAILSDILDISKIEAGKITFECIPFDLRQAVERAVALLYPRAVEKGLHLCCCIHNDIPAQVKGDPTRLRQVLLNLIGNAIKFTRTGEVLLTVDLIAAPNGARELRFAIRDTGIGIEPSIQERLFHPFIQADGSTTRKYGGTGLGLYISKQLVEAMGGSLGLTSTPGEGSTFSFTAPLQSVEDVHRANPRFAGRSALVVSRFPSLRNTITHYLFAAGITSSESSSASEGAEALRAALAENRVMDVVIIDSDFSDDAIRILLDRLGTDPALSRTKPLLINSKRTDTVDDFSDSIPAISRPVKRDALFSALDKLLRSEKSEGNTLSSLPQLNQLPAGGPRILVAEDNPVNQRLATRMLEKLGYSAHVVANGLQAVQSLSSSTYQAILMDCQMPEMDGYEATRLIRERHPQLPIIAMTANAMQGDQEKCIRAGMTDYVSKPIRVQTLEAALKRCLAAIPTVGT